MAILALSSLTSRAADIYVDGSVAGGDGTSWATAYAKIQDALTAAVDGNSDVIHIAAGTYTPVGETPDVSDQYTVDKDVTILGGYPTGGGIRNPRANRTVLSGDLDGGTTYAQSLLVASAVYQADGLVLRNTYNNNTSNGSATAPLVFNAGSQTSYISNFIIEQNKHRYSSVVALRTGTENQSNPVVIENCLIQKNGTYADEFSTGSSSHGAILFSSTGGIKFNNCTLYRNHAESGAIYHGGTNNVLTATFNSCLFKNDDTNELLYRNSGSGAGKFIFLNTVFDGTGVLAGRSMSSGSVAFNCLFSRASFSENGVVQNQVTFNANFDFIALKNNGGVTDNFCYSASSDIVDSGITVLQDDSDGTLYYESTYGDGASAKNIADDSVYSLVGNRTVYTPAADANGTTRTEGVNTLDTGAAESIFTNNQIVNTSFEWWDSGDTNNWEVSLTKRTATSGSTKPTLPAAGFYDGTDSIDTLNKWTFNDAQSWSRVGANLGGDGDNSLFLEQNTSYAILQPTSIGGISTISFNLNNASGSGTATCVIYTRIQNSGDDWVAITDDKLTTGSENDNSTNVGISRTGDTTFDSYVYTINMLGNIELKIARPSGTSGKGIFFDKLVIEDFNYPQTYVDTNVTPSSVTDTVAGTQNLEVAGIQIETNSSDSAYALTGLELGTTGLADVDTLKIYSTGNSPNFDLGTATLVHTISSPSGSTQSITAFTELNPTLYHGTNYFWIAYDVSTSATFGATFDASCSQITINNGAAENMVPTVQDPSGNIAILDNSFESITTADLSGPVTPWLGNSIASGATMTASSGITVDETGLIENNNSLSIPIGETLEFDLTASSGYVERLTFKTRAKTADSTSTIRLEAKQTAGGTYTLVYEGEITSLAASISDYNFAIDQLGADLFIKLTNVATTGGDGNLYIDKTIFIEDAYLAPSSPRWSSENGDYFAISGVDLNGTTLTSGTMHNDQNAPAPLYQTGADSGYDYYINWNRIATPVPSTGLRPGADYAITLTESGGTFSGKLRYYGWLDQNGDGEFSADELLFETGTRSGTNATFDQLITIPATAAEGTTRLRLRCTYNWNTDGTSHSIDSPSGKYGEVEDYMVTIDSSAAVMPILSPAVVFTDNMVIQRNKDIRVWGEGNDSGQTITATLKNSSDTVVATGSSTVGADLKYNFDITADLTASTEAHTLDLVLDDGSNSTTITYSDIVIGDVWIASGQSNMKLTISEMTGSTFATPIPAGFEIVNFPNVRLLKTGESKSSTPNERPGLTNGSWIKATSGVGSYSAVAYFYGAHINKVTKEAGNEIPVGVVIGAIGGTEIEEWMDDAGLELYESYAHAKNIEDGNGNPDNQLGWTAITPANCFNGTLHAVTNLGCKGFIWYQGEYNFGNAAKNGIANYGAMLQDLCRRWRTIFNVKDAEAPFYAVELAPHRYDSADSTGFGAFKQGMREILKLNNTGIALLGDDITSNIEYTNHGGTTNVAIHPGQKAPVGERLSRIALENVYGIDQAGDAMGPVATTAVLDGTTLTVNFDNGVGLNRLDGTLATSWLLNDNLPFDSAAVVESRFEVATQDGVFTQVDWADVAFADGKVTLSNVSTDTVHVRYGYEEWANINVKNSAGIPAGSFTLSTDKTGRSERAVQFPLSSGALSIDPGTKLATVRGMTVEAWIKPDTPLTSPRVDTIISRWVDGTAASSSFQFSKDDNNALIVKLQPYDGSAAVVVTTGNGAGIDEDWQHVAFSYSSLTDEVKIYVDGVVVKTETHALLIESNMTDAIYIGSSNASGLNEFYGGLDEIKIWTRALSETEIFDNVTPPLTPAKAQSMPELFAAYNFDYAEPLTRSGATVAYDLNGGQLNANTDGTATLGTIPQAPALTPVVGIEVSQTDELLTWTIQDEVNVKEYRVVDAVTGEILQVVTADGSSVYQVVLPEGVEAKLVVVDNSGFTQTFYPNNGSTVTVEYTLIKGWNLITVPGYNTNLSPLNSATTGDFWIWNGEAYEVATQPEITQGFWVYADDNKTVRLSAEKSTKEISLQTGWNLVGPTKNCYAPEEASIVYAWNEIYEQILDSNILVQGVGYWMFSF